MLLWQRRWRSASVLISQKWDPGFDSYQQLALCIFWPTFLLFHLKQLDKHKWLVSPNVFFFENMLEMRIQGLLDVKSLYAKSGRNQAIVSHLLDKQLALRHRHWRSNILAELISQYCVHPAVEKVSFYSFTSHNSLRKTTEQLWSIFLMNNSDSDPS